MSGSRHLPFLEQTYRYVNTYTSQNIWLILYIFTYQEFVYLNTSRTTNEICRFEEISVLLFRIFYVCGIIIGNKPFLQALHIRGKWFVAYYKVNVLFLGPYVLLWISYLFLMSFLSTWLWIIIIEGFVIICCERFHLL